MRTSSLFRLMMAAGLVMAANTVLARVQSAETPSADVDGWVTSKIKSKLALSANLDTSRIEIVVRQGMAVVVGTARNPSERDRILKLVGQTDGVEDIDYAGLIVDPATAYEEPEEEKTRR